MQASIGDQLPRNLEVNEGVSLGARCVPPPEGASTEVQAASQDTPSTLSEAWQTTAPEGTAAWSELIQIINNEETAFTDAYLTQSNVTVVSDRIAGVPVCRVTPHLVEPRLQAAVYVQLHGGAYVAGGDGAGLSEAILIADRVRIPVLAIDYRMPPTHPCPAAIDDATAVYQKLLDTRDPSEIAVGGSSAGGGLAVAVVQALRARGVPRPGALFAGTPWVDLSKTGDSYFANEGLDRVLLTYEGVLAAAAILYAGDLSLKDPCVSPIYGEFDNFPPALLVSGSRDLFLSCTIRLHTELRAAKVAADLLVYEGMSHGDYAQVTDAPESLLFFDELKTFLLRHLC